MKIGHIDSTQNITGVLGTKKCICTAHLEMELKFSPCILFRKNFLLINLDFSSCLETNCKIRALLTSGSETEAKLSNV